MTVVNYEFFFASMFFIINCISKCSIVRYLFKIILSSVTYGGK